MFICLFDEVMDNFGWESSFLGPVQFLTDLDSLVRDTILWQLHYVIALEKHLIHESSYQWYISHFSDESCIWECLLQNGDKPHRSCHKPSTILRT